MDTTQCQQCFDGQGRQITICVKINIRILFVQPHTSIHCRPPPHKQEHANQKTGPSLTLAHPTITSLPKHPPLTSHQQPHRSPSHYQTEHTCKAHTLACWISHNYHSKHAEHISYHNWQHTHLYQYLLYATRDVKCTLLKMNAS